jgi:hypothetical protein
MLRSSAMLLAAALIVLVACPATVSANELAIAPVLPLEDNIIPVQWPGSGRGPGWGDGRGPRRGEVRCRMVRGVPGSGMGPQRVCEPVRCRTVVIPGSGLGPQRVCD